MRMNLNRSLIVLPAMLMALVACDTVYPPTPQPDYMVHTVQTPKGLVAVPPPCTSWSANTLNPYDEQPLPQFGCATARNLAMMVERPEDLVKGRDFGNSSPVTTVGALRRYNSNQTRGLLDVSTSADMAPAATTMSTPNSGINGDAPTAAPAASSAAPASP